MWSIIIIIVAIILLFVVLKLYFEKFDTVIAYTGGLGSGKTFKGVQQSIKLLKRVRLRVKVDNVKALIHNLFFAEKKTLIKDTPMLYSSIPIFVKQRRWYFKRCNLIKFRYKYWVEYNNNHDVKISRYVRYSEFKSLNLPKKYVDKYIESSIELTEDYLLLQTRQSYKAVTFLDEIGGFVNQYEYSNPNVINCLDEYIRLYRHYTHGGYLICTEQCSDSICKPIRVRLNKVFNLMNFRSWFNLVYSVNIREISLSEDIKTIEKQNVEDNMKVSIGLFPFCLRYDTYCYSDRYLGVPYRNVSDVFDGLKRYSLLQIPRRRVYYPKTKNSKSEVI